MLEVIIDIIGIAFIIYGVTFTVIGVVGLYRLPDTLSRLHASGKVSSMGTWGLLIGVAFLMPTVSAILKLVLLGIFFFITAPLTSHMIAAAVQRRTAKEESAS